MKQFDELRQMLIAIYDCCFAWDNDDGKMAEMREKTPEDILAEYLEKAKIEGMEEARKIIIQAGEETEKEHGSPNVYIDMVSELACDEIDQVIANLKSKIKKL